MTGRTKGLNKTNIFKAVALTVTAFVMFACQKEDIDTGSGNLVKILPVFDRKIETVVTTRAVGDAISSNYYSEYADNAQTYVQRQTLTAQVVAFKTENNVKARATQKDSTGVFAPVPNGGWRSGVDVEAGYEYNLYAYSRAMPSPSDPVFAYNNGVATLTFDGLYLLSTTDPIASVAASGKMLADDYTSNDVPTLHEGEFNIGLIGTPAQNSSQKFRAFLAMDHLYAKASLSFCIDGTYSQLRSIRITDLQISTPQGLNSGHHTYDFVNNYITSDQNATISGSPYVIDLFDGPTAVAQPNQGQEYITLTTGYRQFGYFYFLPMSTLEPIILTVTYDVCDLKGNVVRENQTATNNKLLDGISHDGGYAQRGFDYQVKVTVSPTYLYTLSDDDVELELTIE